ncbi:clostripain-related cysteine peptidase [Candidatus Amarolinea aalborgensis]|uniref:clostripain-related cysteine peptidase n=1 Tax=Candidatus Amarolinea aalborgensis TaxID=2249329 RepID=UPI003BF9A734
MSNYRIRHSALILLILMLLPLLAACNEEPPDTPTAAVTPSPTARARPGTKTPLPPVKPSYSSPDLAFSLDYPSDWRVSDKNASSDGVLFYVGDRETSLWVQRQEFGGAADAANRAGIAYLKGVNSRPGISQVVYQNEPTVYRAGGLDGLRLDYSYVARNKTPQQGVFIAVTTAEGHTYLLNFEAPQAVYPSDVSIFTAMLQTLRISGVAVDPANPVSKPPTDRSAEAEWLIMLYVDADDNILERDMMVDLNEVERVGSSDQVHIVAQVDRYKGAFSGMGNWTSTKRFYITKDDDLGKLSSPELADLGELNMADGQTLSDFITWAVVNYPARKHALILSDHGSGWPGGFSDPAPGGQGRDKLALAEEMDDNLWLMELDTALGAARQKTGLDKFELIGFDACLMGMLEVYTTLTPHARYAVASEEVEPALGWAYAGFLSQLSANPAMNGADLGRAIVNSYIAQDQRILDATARRQLLKENDMDESLDSPSVVKEFSVDVTLAAVDLNAVPTLNQAVNRLSTQLAGLERSKITGARANAQSFENAFDDSASSPYIDLGHFVKLLRSQSGSAAVKQAADAVLAAMGQVVVAQRHGPERPGATGISIYFPSRTLFRTQDNWQYTRIASRFAQVSGWDDFLAAHYGSRRSDAAPKRTVTRFATLSKPIQIEPLRLSATTAAAGRPVNLQTTISGRNLGFVYHFIGRTLPEEQAILIEDMDYVMADDTQEIDGVAYPAWPAEDVAVDLDWEPTLFSISDGVTTTPALLMPAAYGDTPTYTVEGIYRFADGSSERFARISFRDGRLTQVLGYPRLSNLGAPRAITPAPGDTFTVLQQMRKVGSAAMDPLDAVSEQGAAFTREGGTLTFGDTAWTVVERPAAAGSYVIGVIADDLDGQRSAQFDTVFVENAQAVAVNGFKPYTNSALAIALLYPAAWSVEEDAANDMVSFTDDKNGALVLVVRDSYPDADSADAANAQGLTDALALFTADSELKNVVVAPQAESVLLGAYPAMQRGVTFTLDGEPLQALAVVSSPTRNATFTVLLLSAATDFPTMQTTFQPLLASFDIMLTGLNKEPLGSPAPNIQRVLWQDTFNADDSGLTEDSGDWGAAGYSAAGQYAVSLNPYGGPLYDYYADESLPARFVLQAATSFSGAENNGYGLIFQVTDSEQFYSFQISGDGFFGVDRIDDAETVTTLIDWTPSDLIMTAEKAINTLTVAGDGGAYRLYINGRQVASFNDDRYQGGSFGLIADNYDEEAPAGFTFDELTLGAP